MSSIPTNPRVGNAKDPSDGAVLVAAIAALVIERWYRAAARARGG